MLVPRNTCATLAAVCSVSRVVFVADVLDRELRAQHVLGLGALAARHRRIEQLGHHHVVRPIVPRSWPAANRDSCRASECRPCAEHVLAGQGVFPKRRPMRRIVALAREQLIDQLLALGLIGRRRQESDSPRSASESRRSRRDRRAAETWRRRTIAGSARPSALLQRGDDELIDRIERWPVDRRRAGRRRQLAQAARRAARSTAVRCRARRLERLVAGASTAQTASTSRDQRDRQSHVQTATRCQRQRLRVRVIDKHRTSQTWCRVARATSELL